MSTEKMLFLGRWEREFETTRRVLLAYPEGNLDLRPHERARTAKELAWVLAYEEQILIGGALAGQISLGAPPSIPHTFAEILAVYEENHNKLVIKLRSMPDEEFENSIRFMTAPKTWGNVRVGDICWETLLDAIHHRGQFSVYLRMAGGKVPSIYGPSADEPWN